MISLALFLESGGILLFSVAGADRFSLVPHNLGIASVHAVHRFLLLASAGLLAAGAVSLLVRWKPGWWAALAVELLGVLNLGGIALFFGTLVRAATSLGAMDAPALLGVGLLGFSGLGWHLLLALGLLRGDVREHMGLADVDPWSAAGRGALAGTAAMLVVFGIRLGAGWLTSRIGTRPGASRLRSCSLVPWFSRSSPGSACGATAIARR
jgi:hypothetical protein